MACHIFHKSTSQSTTPNRTENPRNICQNPGSETHEKNQQNHEINPQPRKNHPRLLLIGGFLSRITMFSLQNTQGKILRKYQCLKKEGIEGGLFIAIFCFYPRGVLFIFLFDAKKKGVGGGVARVERLWSES